MSTGLLSAAQSTRSLWRCNALEVLSSVRRCPCHSRFASTIPKRNKHIPFDRFALVTRDGLVSVDKAGVLAVLSILTAPYKRTDDEIVAELVSDNTPVPLVKLLSRREIGQRDGKAKENKKSSKMQHKESQFTWNMSDTDIEHKLDRVRKDLAKGFRVDLVFAAKRKTRWPTQKEMEERLDSILELISDAGSEWKPRSIVGGMGALFIQGNKVDIPQPESLPTEAQQRRESRRQEQQEKDRIHQRKVELEKKANAMLERQAELARQAEGETQAESEKKALFEKQTRGRGRLYAY